MSGDFGRLYINFTIEGVGVELFLWGYGIAPISAPWGSTLVVGSKSPANGMNFAHSTPITGDRKSAMCIVEREGIA